MNPSTTIEKLFEVYSKRLVRYADGFLGERFAMTGEDAVSSAFLRLCSVDLSVVMDVSSYLYNIVKKECLNIIKIEENRNRIASGIQIGGGVSDEYSDSLVVKNELIGELTNVYESLPPARKRIFEMVYFEKKSLNDIADELNLSRNTIYTQKNRIDQSFGFKDKQRWWGRTREGSNGQKWITWAKSQRTTK